MKNFKHNQTGAILSASELEKVRVDYHDNYEPTDDEPTHTADLDGTQLWSIDGDKRQFAGMVAQVPPKGDSIDAPKAKRKK